MHHVTDRILNLSLPFAQSAVTNSSFPMALKRISKSEMEIRCVWIFKLHTSVWKSSVCTKIRCISHSLWWNKIMLVRFFCFTQVLLCLEFWVRVLMTLRSWLVMTKKKWRIPFSYKRKRCVSVPLNKLKWKQTYHLWWDTSSYEPEQSNRLNPLVKCVGQLIIAGHTVKGIAFQLECGPGASWPCNCYRWFSAQVSHFENIPSENERWYL